MRRWVAVLAVGWLLVVGRPGSASAQLSLGGFNLEGEVEAGPVLFIDEPSRSRKGKFEEYRDMTEGLWLHRLQLRLFRPDESYSTELEGSKWGYEDQYYRLGAGRLGLWQFNFEWDQIPHVYSTTARLLARETERGVYRLDTPRPAPLSVHNSAPELGEVSTRWDTARMSLVLSPSPDFDVVAEYTRINKDGNRPFSMAFGSPGNNFYEVLEPIEHTIHDIRLRGTFARENWQLQFGYGLSVFQNSVSKLVVDNPCFANAGACGAGDGGAAAPSAGQISLPPDNMAHSFNIAAGVNLPMRTRINGAFNYSLRLQNDAFLPHTINPALAANPNLRLPQRDLNGNVQTILASLGATTRPLKPLTLSAKYRYYEMFDLSDEITLPSVAVNDRSVSGPRRPGRWDYSKQNADIDARWQIVQPVALTLGVGWERWERNEHREVGESDEFFGKAALDVTPAEWLLIRATYRPSFRRYNHYDPRAHAEHTVEEDAVAAAQGQSVFLRKFDEGERNRQQVDVLFQFTPFETMSITPTFGFRQDDYIASRLGLQDETSWSAGMDVSWSPAERVAFSAGYVYEQFSRQIRSRSRPVTGTTTFDFKDFEWVSNQADTVNTVHAGIRATLIPRVLDWTAGANYSIAVGSDDTRNPVTPASGTAAQRTSATAKPIPTTQDQLLHVETALRYHFSKAWTASLGYAFESFQKNDWRTDRLTPVLQGVTSIWLGDDDRNYTAHLVGVTLTYRFK
jgi:MtrB/PioB family decaheme-associated outer membrane protein